MKSIWEKQVNRVKQIFQDENHTCEFDFTKAQWATDELHDIYVQAKAGLTDVDYLVETEKEILLIEYKNADIAEAAHPERFNIKSDKKINSLVKKYYDSLHYLTLTRKGKDKRKIYVCILEYPGSDGVSQRYVRNRLADKLPFVLQKQINSGEKLIDEVHVWTIRDWNQQYSEFPARKLKM